MGRNKGEQRGSVRRRGGSWHIQFHAWDTNSNGVFGYWPQERRVEGSEKMSKRHAEQAGYDQWVAKANGPARGARSQLTLSDFIELRFKPDHIANLKKTGRKFYATILNNHIIPALGAVRLAELSTPMIQGLIASKRETHSVQTLHHLRNCLSAVLGHAKTLRFIEGDPATVGVKLPALEVEKPRQALTAQQIELLLEVIDPRYRALVRVLAETGLRIGEALGLRWKNVNLSDEWLIAGTQAIPANSLFVCENWVRGERTTLKTATSRRLLPLTSGAWVALQGVCETTKWGLPEHPVFANRHGKPLDGHNIAKRFLKEAGGKIGCPWVHWHSFRHGVATMADKFLTPAEKQALLGHATGRMSARYTHAAVEDVREGLEKATGRVN